MKFYSQCNILEKLLRRIKYQLPYTLKAAYIYTRYLHKDKEYARFISVLTYREWQSKARHTYSIDKSREILEELSKRA